MQFQSICSSSAGNSVALWSDNTKLLIDCGLSSMKRTRAALSAVFGDPGSVDSVLITHAHSDHVSYYPLRVLDEYGLCVRMHEDCVDQVRGKHFKDYGFDGLTIEPFTKKDFIVGDFCVKPFEVSHNPYYPTYGYEILWQEKKVVIVTDFSRWDEVFEHFVDADFIFVESNHDLELLDMYYNPNSAYHMPNPDTAELLVNVRRQSKKAPGGVMLGHLSSQRNEIDIALAETTTAFETAGVEMDFSLMAAPLKEPGNAIRIA